LEEQNGITARVRVLESQMKDVKDSIKTTNSRLGWLLGMGWVMVGGLIALIVKS
jgi:hypothetical protein